MRPPARAGILFLAVALTAPAVARAHPMGNFSVSHYAGIRVQAEAVEVRYLVDLAEIPTFQELQDSGLRAEPGDPGVGPYLARKAAQLGTGLVVELDGRRLPLVSAAREILFTPGAGGLPTMKIGVVYRATLDALPGAAPRRLDYRDQNFPDRAGWKEVVATAGPGMQIAESSVPERDRSRELGDYPTDLLDSPPQTLEAIVTFAPLASRPVIARAGAADPPSRSETATSVRPDAAAPEASRRAGREALPGVLGSEPSATPASAPMLPAAAMPSPAIAPSASSPPTIPASSAATGQPRVAAPAAISASDASVMPAAPAMSAPPVAAAPPMGSGSSGVRAPAGADALELVPRPPPAASPAVTTAGGLEPAPKRNPTLSEAPARPLGLEPNRAARRRDAFTDLIATSEMSASVLLFAILAAAALGALHALEPGHGKTVVAAYLVGSRGTARHALLLGIIVTASHTAGVYLLGGITLYASRYVVPERLFPWLGALSGLTIAGLGLVLVARRWAGGGHAGHDHPHPHSHLHAPVLAPGDARDVAMDLDHRHGHVELRLLEHFHAQGHGGVNGHEFWHARTRVPEEAMALAAGSRQGHAHVDLHRLLPGDANGGAGENGQQHSRAVLTWNGRGVARSSVQEHAHDDLARPEPVRARGDVPNGHVHGLVAEDSHGVPGGRGDDRAHRELRWSRSGSFGPDGRAAANGHAHEHSHWLMTGNGRALAEASDHTHEHGKVAAQGPAPEDSRPRHRHHGHGRGHGHHHHHAVGEGVSLRSLVVLGITGGIVPCPAALVVLLSAVALHRIGFGLVLIAAFSAGLAAVLIAIGLLVVYARRVMGRFRGEGPLISRWLPLASAVVITALGIAIALQSLRAAGSL